MRAQHTFPGATDSWLQRLLTWTPGQTDMIKTVALVLMVTDHTGLLLAGNNEVMRLLGRGCFPLFGLAWGMNLARHAEIRQSQLNSLWGWALVAQVSFMLIGYPWYTGNILFAFAVTGQVLRWVSQPSWYYTLPAAGLLVTWIPLSTGSYGMAGVGMLTASCLSRLEMCIVLSYFFPFSAPADCPILIGEAAGADKPQARQSPPSVFSRLRSRTMSRSTACRRSRCRRSEATC